MAAPDIALPRAGGMPDNRGPGLCSRRPGQCGQRMSLHDGRYWRHPVQPDRDHRARIGSHGFPSLPGHNNPTPAIQASDVIFRMGATAFDVCSEAVTAGTFANRALQGFPRVGLGGACNRDPDCQSSNCRDGHCICVQDSDCGSGRICERLGRNTCLSSRLANGASCQRDRQCTSGRCRRDRCS